MKTQKHLVSTKLNYKTLMSVLQSSLKTQTKTRFLTQVSNVFLMDDECERRTNSQESMFCANNIYKLRSTSY